jgi:hypothetical protein
MIVQNGEGASLSSILLRTFEMAFLAVKTLAYTFWSMTIVLYNESIWDATNPEAAAFR